MGVGYNPRIVTNGLVLHLDAGNTKSYPGSGTTWYDVSGNGYDGTLINSPVYSGGSFTFNGFSDKRITCPVPTQTTPIVFEFWVNPGSDNPIGIFDTAPGTAHVLRNYPAGYFEWWEGNPSVALGLTASNWYQIVVAFTYSTVRNLKYYKNGNLISSTNGTATPTVGWTSPIAFGVINNGPGGNYNGKIANIKMYNRELTATEVSQNFNALRGRYGI